MLTFVAVIVASCSLFLTSHREVAYALHVTDDTCQIVNVFAVAFRTLLEVVLADMTALVADGVRDVECEIITSFLSGNTQKLAVLSLSKMLFKVQMKG